MYIQYFNKLFQKIKAIIGKFNQYNNKLLRSQDISCYGRHIVYQLNFKWKYIVDIHNLDKKVEYGLTRSFIKGHADRILKHVLCNMKWITAPFRPHISRRRSCSNIFICKYFFMILFLHFCSYARAYSKRSFFIH